MPAIHLVVRPIRDAAELRALVDHAIALHRSADQTSTSWGDWRRRRAAAYRQTIDVYLHAAAAYELAGRARPAAQLVKRARRLERILGFREATYRRERARFVPAAQAFARAKDAPWITVLGTVYDQPASLEDWTPFIVRGIQADAQPELEVVVPTYSRGPRGRRVVFRVYETDLAREPVPDWIDLKSYSTYADTTPTAVRREHSSRSYATRARINYELMRYYGPDNWDSQPWEMTRREVEQRYRRRFTKDD